MASRKRNKMQSEPGLEEPGTIPPPPKMPRVEVTEPRTSLPDRTPTMTARRAFIAQRFEPLMKAFFVEEEGAHKIRRLTKNQWKAEYAAFLKKPR